ncbi:AMP-binding protein [soil metagenome]
MQIIITPQQLIQHGSQTDEAENLSNKINVLLTELPAEQCWQQVSSNLLTAAHPFSLHQFLYKLIYPHWDSIPAPAWVPTKNIINTANLTQLMTELKINTYSELYAWSVQNYREFWQHMLKILSIKLIKNYDDICDLQDGIESPNWLHGAKLNIAASCFTATPTTPAILYQIEGGTIQQMSYAKLNALSNRVANGLQRCGIKPGDTVAIDMVMTANAVAIYLGIIKAGAAVISIADSFAPEEIAARLRIAKASAIFTQDHIVRGGKQLPLYEKVMQANAPLTIVLPAEDKEAELSTPIRSNDLSWQKFLSDNEHFEAVACNPGDAINILFSSGTTGDPKAIPWNHTTPIKCGSDAWIHQNIQAGDILTWPTNIGWMMGPWLIFAALLNKATIGLFAGAPTSREFGEFVQNSKTTMLGLVPSIVNAWRSSACMEGLDWSAIKVFSSSGECSNIEDMFYLSWLAGHRPIIEYCGGTEIGGGYISGTVIQPSAPAAFTTPTLGLQLFIMDDTGEYCDNGEVSLIPPSMGLSNILLNKDHHQVYYADMPTSPNGQVLRRHGDQIQHINKDYYRILGRVDDTMNLGGIKTSSAELERAVSTLAAIKETAAIAITPLGGGPSQLIMYVVPTDPSNVNADELKKLLQQAIKQHLNPLFKVHDVIVVNSLPRTASNKVMRRVLRDEYQKRD